MRPLPDTKDRSNKSTAPTATTEALVKPPGARRHSSDELAWKDGGDRETIVCCVYLTAAAECVVHD